MKILYICSSQFSGTTLTSFLLNNHRAIATIGHTTGWKYGPEEDFRCSCGERLAECPLFRHVRQRFEERGLTFDPRNFGTDFRLAESVRINRWLLGSLPALHSSNAERLRDWFVHAIPPFRHRLAAQHLANETLIGSVLEYHAASVYLDNSHSPYRFRILSDNSRFEVSPVHLIRDPRGVALSMMTNSGFRTDQAIESWLSHQLNIFRITREAPKTLLLQYEELCRNPDAELARLQDFAGLPHEPFSGDFKERDHHILGNRMRLSSGQIHLDERWRKDLQKEDRAIIEDRLGQFMRTNPEHRLSDIINHYLRD